MKNNVIITVLLISQLILSSEGNQSTNTNQTYSVTVQYSNGELANPNDNDAQEARRLLDEEIVQGMSTQGLEEVVLQVDHQTGEIVSTAYYDDGCCEFNCLRRQ